MLQQIINIFYRYPGSRLKRYKRFGGYLSYRKMIKASRQMAVASIKLTPVKSYTDGLPVYFLTGKKYLYQTLFCLQSLVKVSAEKFRFILVDDGSFDHRLIKLIATQVTDACIVTRAEIDENLNKYLPQNLYPALHQKRKVYPHLKKLTDIHTIPGNDWKLVLDSDMLFWNNPQLLVKWLQSPQQPIHMLDCIESYGYSKKLMQKLCGHSVPELLNVGAIGLNSTTINWSELNNWINILEAEEGTSYYLEQALTAMLIGNATTTVLKPNEYIVNPAEEAIINNTGILHHYVDLSKKGYFNIAWKSLI